MHENLQEISQVFISCTTHHTFFLTTVAVLQCLQNDMIFSVLHVNHYLSYLCMGGGSLLKKKIQIHFSSHLLCAEECIAFTVFLNLWTVFLSTSRICKWNQLERQLKFNGLNEHRFKHNFDCLDLVCLCGIADKDSDHFLLHFLIL